jgi:calcium binding protein 39
MTKYIANEANLKMMMNLLRDKSKNIQFEAFHVFKVGLIGRQRTHKRADGFVIQVFVANPKKPPQIESILRRNKEKLLKFLKDFHNDKDDEQFSVRYLPFRAWLKLMKSTQDEKQFLIVQIEGL